MKTFNKSKNFLIIKKFLSFFHSHIENKGPIPSNHPKSRNSRKISKSNKDFSFVLEFEELDNTFDKKRDSKMSYEEIIYDIITEIPHYFDLDHKFKDDMNIKDSKVKHYENIQLDIKKDNNSKSVGRKKSVLDIDGKIKRKSKLTCINCKEKEKIKITEKDYCMNLLSSCEAKINSEKAQFKYEMEDNSVVFHSGFVIITDFRFIFKFDDKKVYERINLAEAFFSIPLFCINR
jgi:hypothetical protein